MPSPNMSLYAVWNTPFLQFLNRSPHGKHLCLKDKYWQEYGCVELTSSALKMSSIKWSQVMFLVSMIICPFKTKKYVALVIRVYTTYDRDPNITLVFTLLRELRKSHVNTDIAHCHG